MLTGPIYTVQNIGPEFCVRGCDIARACKGYIISEDTKLRSYIMYIGPISILYTIYCMEGLLYTNSPHQRDDVTIILYIYVYTVYTCTCIYTCILYT